MSNSQECGCTSRRTYSDDEIFDLVTHEVEEFLQSMPHSLVQTRQNDFPFPRIPRGISNRHIHMTNADAGRLDTDDANAAYIREEVYGEFIGKM